MKQKKNARIWKIIGIMCFALGVIGLFLLGIQGILLMLVGLSLLGYIHFRKKC